MPGTKAPLFFNYEPASPEWLARAAAIETVCEQFDVPLRAAALQFPLAHPAIELILAGVRRVEHWEDLAAKLSHPIPAAFWQTWSDAGLLPAAAPTP